jgi:hypothetical protein
MRTVDSGAEFARRFGAIDSDKRRGLGLDVATVAHEFDAVPGKLDIERNSGLYPGYSLLRSRRLQPATRTLAHE